jgi:hypothetical protein
MFAKVCTAICDVDKAAVGSPAHNMEKFSFDANVQCKKHKFPSAACMFARTPRHNCTCKPDKRTQRQNGDFSIKFISRVGA